MATPHSLRPADGLFPATLLEFFAGLSFLGFILLAASVLLNPKTSFMSLNQFKPIVSEEIKEKSYEDPDAVAEKLADRLGEKLGHTFSQRDERLGQMILGLGDKLDRVEGDREGHWSQLQKGINDKLDTFLQDVALRVAKNDEPKVEGANVPEAPVQLAQKVSEPMPVVSDAVKDHQVLVDQGNPVGAAPISDRLPVDVSAVSSRFPVVDLGADSQSTRETVAITPSQADETGQPGVLGAVGPVSSKSEGQPVTAPLEDGVFNPAPVDAQKRGFFLSLGCFSQTSNAIERGHKVRPFLASVYKKSIQNGAMICVFSGPYEKRNDAQETLKHLDAGVSISGFSIGSY